MDKETKRRIEEIREKYKDNPDIQLLVSNLTALELKLRDADVTAVMIDVAVRRGLLDARSGIADARISYGTPWEYEFARRDYLLKCKGDIEEVREALSREK